MRCVSLPERRPQPSTFVEPQDDFNYAPVNYLLTPSQRYNVLEVHHNLTDRVDAFFEALYVDRSSSQLLAPEPLLRSRRRRRRGHRSRVVSANGNLLNVFNPYNDGTLGAEHLRLPPPPSSSARASPCRRSILSASSPASRTPPREPRYLPGLEVGGLVQPRPHRRDQRQHGRPDPQPPRAGDRPELQQRGRPAVRHADGAADACRSTSSARPARSRRTRSRSSPSRCRTASPTSASRSRRRTVSSPRPRGVATSLPRSASTTAASRVASRPTRSPSPVTPRATSSCRPSVRSTQPGGVSPSSRSSRSRTKFAEWLRVRPVGSLLGLQHVRQSDHRQGGLPVPPPEASRSAVHILDRVPRTEHLGPVLRCRRRLPGDQATRATRTRRVSRRRPCCRRSARRIRSGATCRLVQRRADHLVRGTSQRRDSGGGNPNLQPETATIATKRPGLGADPRPRLHGRLLGHHDQPGHHGVRPADHPVGLLLAGDEPEGGEGGSSVRTSAATRSRTRSATSATRTSTRRRSLPTVSTRPGPTTSRRRASVACARRST